MKNVKVQHYAGGNNEQKEQQLSSSDQNIPEEMDEINGLCGIVELPKQQVGPRKIFELKGLIDQELRTEKKKNNDKTTDVQQLLNTPHLKRSKKFEDFNTPIIHATSSPKINKIPRNSNPLDNDDDNSG